MTTENQEKTSKRTAIGIISADGSFAIPALGKLGDHLGIASSYGIRNAGTARSWLSDKIVGIVFVSNETKCHVDQVGRLASEEQIQAVAEEFALRNPQPGAPEASPMQRVPISSIQPGVVDAGWRDAIPVSQPENELLLRYQARLGRELTAGPVQHPQSTTWLRIDAYDDQTDTLIEAKSSARRTHVLQAIAQLHDYGRLIPDHKRKLVLLPAAPEVDLFDLAHSLDVDICYEDGSVFRTDPQGGPR